MEQSQVSIPRRYAKNPAALYVGQGTGPEFQFLVGTLKTEIEDANGALIEKFQFLVGTLKTINITVQDGEDLCFNSS